MKIYVLFGQRKCSYEGEYAPEPLDVNGEFGHEDNPDFLAGRQKHYQDSNEFTSLAIVPIEFSGSTIEKILRPTIPAVEGKVVEG